MIRWIGNTRATYFGNATAVRDFRSQLRGSKAFWLWGSYLVVLIAICAFAYNQFADQGTQSISSLQRQLTVFYHTIIGMLGGVIVLVAPGLTAAAITTEKQRRSLDLIFSAPVRPRYLLVGKMIAGLRYLMMLLILALPVVSVCVVMGGATWGDVIGSFLNLLNAGIVMLAIGLLMSSVIQTTIGAILASYAAIGVYCFLTGGLAASAIGAIGAGMGSGQSYEAPWFGNLVPFTASVTAPTFTKVGNFEVPNWAMGLLFALLVSKLLLAGAGSALSPYGSAETKSLRIHGLIAAFAGMFLIAGPIAGGLTSLMTATLVGPTGMGSYGGEAIAAFLGYATCATFFAWPQLMCYGRDAERKYWNDGLFSLSGAFKGTPSGGWLYTVLLVLAFAFGLYGGFSYFSGSSMFATPAAMVAAGSGVPVTSGAPSTPGAPVMVQPGSVTGPMTTPAPTPAPTTPTGPPPTSVMTAIGTMSVWCLGFLTLWWGIARYTSAKANNLKGARLGLISAVVVLVAIPTPIIAGIASSRWDYETTGMDPLWRFHIMYPLFARGVPLTQAMYGVVFAVIGVALAILSEKKYRLKNPENQDV